MNLMLFVWTQRQNITLERNSFATNRPLLALLWVSLIISGLFFKADISTVDFLKEAVSYFYGRPDILVCLRLRMPRQHTTSKGVPSTERSRYGGSPDKIIKK
jgi:hypothetical protein